MKKFENFRITVRIFLMFVLCSFSTAIYFFLWNVFYNSQLIHSFRGEGQLFLVVVYFLVLIVTSSFLGVSRVDELRKSEIIFYGIIALVFTNLIAYTQICLVKAELASIFGMLYIMLVQIVFLVIWTLISYFLIHRFNQPEEMVIIYGSHLATEIVYKMGKMEDRYKILESINVDEGYDAVVEKIENFNSVIICDVPARFRNDILKYCYEKDKNIYVVPKISDIIIKSGADISYFDSPIMRCTSRGLTVEQLILKRLCDLFFSGLALLLLSPIFFLIAVAIKIEDGGPVFYKQLRCTRNLEKFNILKFRSMVVDAEKDGPKPATDNDDRITKVGKILRKLRIDELPQIINILKGDMSIVGPRPERIEHVEKYSKEIPEFVCRYKVKGGLTGYAQVFGKYNTSPYNKLKMDLIYIQNYSFALDVKLIIMTFKILFKSESTEGFKEKGKSGK